MCPTAIRLALSTFKGREALINIIKVLITKEYACYLFIYLFIFIYNWIDIARREDLNSTSFGWKYFEVSIELRLMFVISNFINVYCRKKQIIITLARLQRWVKTCGKYCRWSIGWVQCSLDFWWCRDYTHKKHSQPIVNHIC